MNEDIRLGRRALGDELGWDAHVRSMGEEVEVSSRPTGSADV